MKNLPSKLKQLSKDPKVADEYWKLASTQYILSLLSEAIEKDLDIAIQSSEKESRYDKPCWSEWLADNTGYRRALRQIKSMIKDTK